MANKAPNNANGTAIKTPMGNDHLSYFADKIRNTINKPKAKTIPDVEPA